jgi:hypothetical protein
MKDYEVTKAEHFSLDQHQVTVEYSDLPSGWHWRLRVNHQVTAWGSARTDILHLNGYVVVSEYFSGTGITPEHPFRATYLRRQS